MKKLIFICVFLTLMATPVLASITVSDGFWSVNVFTGQGDLLLFQKDIAINSFGLFDKTNPSNILEIFSSSDDTGATALVKIINPSGVDFRSTNTTDIPFVVDNAVFAANSFGFYLDSPSGVQFSGTITNQPGSEYQLIWGENDFVVNIESFAPSAIPAPGAILLGGIGVCLVGWLRRRRML